MKHHHHTGTAIVIHHEHEVGEANLSHLDLPFTRCEDTECPSHTPKKLVRPGYRVALRTRKGTRQ